jgi:hypothetical protein
LKDCGRVRPAHADHVAGAIERRWQAFSGGGFGNNSLQLNTFAA